MNRESNIKKWIGRASLHTFSSVLNFIFSTGFSAVKAGGKWLLQSSEKKFCIVVLFAVVSSGEERNRASTMLVVAEAEEEGAEGGTISCAALTGRGAVTVTAGAGATTFTT